MPTDPTEHPAPPERPDRGFAQGRDDPEQYPHATGVGRFSQTEAGPPDETAERHREGSFAEGQTRLAARVRALSERP